MPPKITSEDGGTPRVSAVVAPKTSYRSLPHKLQLFMLLLTRLSEPLFISSFHSYIFFQLQSFDPSASASTIATQSGLMLSSRTAAHVFTGIAWGRLADHRGIGRKNVLIVGLLSSCITTLGYGFSGSFGAAMAWQILDGALNSTVAMSRCMIAELNPEKRHRARALTLLPFFANMGTLLGPLIGGFLTSAKRSSAIFSAYPYAPPNICIACIQALLALCVACTLSETLEGYGTETNKQPSTCDEANSTTSSTNQEQGNETSPLLRNGSGSGSGSGSGNLPSSRPLSFRQMWTSNVISTMVAQFIIAGHLGTFAALWAIFLSTPIAPKERQHPPLFFSGGVGMKPQSVGIALSFLGFTGIILQIVIYPLLQDRFGTLRLWRAALFVFPLAYILAPYCALFASLDNDEGEEKELATHSSPAVWLALLCVLIFFVAGRTCVVPATSLLINDCTPHSSVRGTVHTTAVTVSNLSRSIFPSIALAVFAQGLKVGVVGLGFWFIAGLAVLSCIASMWVREGTNGKQGD